MMYLIGLFCLALIVWLNFRWLVLIPLLSVTHMLPDIIGVQRVQPDGTTAVLVSAAAGLMISVAAVAVIAAMRARFTAAVWASRLVRILAALVFVLVSFSPINLMKPGDLTLVGMVLVAAGLWLLVSSAMHVSFVAKVYRGAVGDRSNGTLRNQAVAKIPQVAQPSHAAQTPIPSNAVPISKARYTLSDVAGMAEMKRQLAPFLKAFQAPTKNAAPDRNGLLLSGPPGNGKTFIAEAIAGELGMPIMFVTTDAIRSQYLGKASEKIGEIVAQAISQAPVVLFLDELDAVGAKRDSANQHEESAIIVNTLLQGINELRKHRVVLVAATNRYEHLDPALIRDGRFDFRVDVPNPDFEARVAIIKGMASKFKVSLDTDAINGLAAFWIERSAAFMEGAFKRARDDAHDTGAPITVNDLKTAGRHATRRETAIPKDCESLDEMFFAPEARDAIASVVYAMKNWDKIEARGGKVPKGVLLYGPPGTGKTAVTRAIARSMGDVHVFEVRTAEVLADPRKFSDLMDLARAHRPAIVFLDEADELLRDRNFSPSATATNEILKAMDGMMSKVPEVYFFAATNNLDALDSAAVRGGRFSERILLDALDGENLVLYIKKALQSRERLPLSPDVDAETIAQMVGRAGPASVNEVLGRAVAHAMTRGDDAMVTKRDLARAIDTVLA